MDATMIDFRTQVENISLAADTPSTFTCARVPEPAFWLLCSVLWPEIGHHGAYVLAMGTQPDRRTEV
jgi:hypothetical protein